MPSLVDRQERTGYVGAESSGLGTYDRMRHVSWRWEAGIGVRVPGPNT